MKPGDIVIIYSDPVNCKNSEGQAKLIKFDRNINTASIIEHWQVEFLDQPGKLYPRLIKKV